MRIIITGDTGFLGSGTFKYLMSRGHEVYGASRKLFNNGVGGKVLYISGEEDILHHNSTYRHYSLNLCNNNCVKIMLENCKPEAILHFAANPLVKIDMNNPGGLIDDNIKTTLNLCYYAPNCKFIFASSLIVYGPNAISEAEPCNPISIYGITKLASEQIIDTYKDKLDYSCFRLGAVVGPELTHGIVKDFIAKIKSDSPTLDVLGATPGSSKSFLHIDDFYKAVDIALNKGMGKVNICNIGLLNVKEIADIVQEKMNTNKPIMWLGENANWRGDNKILYGSIYQAKTYWGWSPKLSSVESIKLAVEQNL